MQKPFFKASIAAVTLTAACLAQAGETPHLARPLAGLGCQASTFKSIPQPSARQPTKSRTNFSCAPLHP